MADLHASSTPLAQSLGSFSPTETSNVRTCANLVRPRGRLANRCIPSTVGMRCPAAPSVTVPTVVMMPKKKGTTRGDTEAASDGAVQRGLVGANAAMEGVGAPIAETKGRVERVMSALAENRWNRKRQLLPNLRLTYPSDDESRHIAELAKINDTSRFARIIESRILDAHLNHASFSTLSIPKVKSALQRLAERANLLTQTLSSLDVGRESRGSEQYAGWLIERELAFQQLETGATVLIPEYIDLLNALSGAAQRAEKKPMHVPKGAGGNPAFDEFIEDLLMAARMLGGHWTNYRLRDQTWTGTLLETLRILEKYLPNNFFPPGELGRSVEHIRKKLGDHIRRARDRQQP